MMEFPKLGDETSCSSFNSNFCLLLANHMLQENAAKGSNAMISPFSFHLMLSLIAVGSKGSTLNQLLHCLGSKCLEDLNSGSSQMIAIAIASPTSNESSDQDLSFLSGVWVKQGLELKPSFQEIVEGVYHAIAKYVDFETKGDEFVAEVNAWAKKATKGLIEKLLTLDDIRSAGEKTALVLANAIYFKGKWTQRFDSSRTEDRVFHLLNGRSIRVPFMTSFDNQRCFEYDSFDGYKVLKLPYKTSHTTRKLAMYFFLPNARDGLNNVLEMFQSNPDHFTRGFNNLPKEELFDFWIPKWKFSFEFEASETMKQLGLTLPFDTSNTEFTEMVDSSQSLYVNKMVHKAFIEVNEEGTEAAACTAATCELVCIKQPIPSFVADHPFMFMIKEDISGVAFFVGSVLNPLLDS